MAEWTGLCEREAELGGEVIAVTLTRASVQELASDVLRSASLGEIHFTDQDGNPRPGPDVAACGARIGQMYNVAAGRKEVDFTPLADTDTITVRDADGQTRVIALIAA